MWHVGIKEVKYEFYITSLQNLISPATLNNNGFDLLSILF